MPGVAAVGGFVESAAGAVVAAADAPGRTRRRPELAVQVDSQEYKTRSTSPTPPLPLTDGGKTFHRHQRRSGGDDYHTIWINPTIPTSSPSPSIKAQPSASRRPNLELLGQPAHRAVLSRHHRQPVSLLVLRRPARKRLRRHRQPQRLRRNHLRDWTTVGVEEYGYVAPDPLHPNLIYGGKVTVFDRNTGQTRDVSPVVLRQGNYRSIAPRRSSSRPSIPASFISDRTSSSRHRRRRQLANISLT